MLAIYSVLKREINSNAYALRTIELLSKAIHQNQKSKIDFLARELVTTLINMGMSTKHIKKTVLSFFYYGDEITTDSLKEFLKEIFPHLHHFSICQKITTAADVLDEENIMPFGLSFSTQLPEFCEGFNDNNDFSILNDNQLFVLAENVEEFDAYSALATVDERIATLHDLFGIYHHKNSYELSDSALVEQCCLPGIRSLQRSKNRMLNVNDFRPKKAAKKLDRLLEDTQIIGGPDAGKFFRLVDFHAMSVSSEIPENQLLNLWISLETLTPPNPKKSIIDNVVNGIIPFIGLNYFRRIFERLTYDLVRWNRRVISDLVKKVDHYRDNTLMQNIVKLIVDKKNEEVLEQLFTYLGDFELLRYRAFTLSQKFSSAQRAIEYLEEHEQRVMWQLRRIYRTRNKIVHSGETPEFTGSLIENAHDYFDQTFELCCTLGSGSNSLLTFSECFNFANWEFRKYKKSLNNILQQSELADLMIWEKKVSPEGLIILDKL
jgi:hypothetical protein